MASVGQTQQHGYVSCAVARSGDQTDRAVLEQVDRLLERRIRLAVAVEVQQLHLRYGRQAVRDIHALAGGESATGRCPRGARSRELCIWQQAHAARVVEVEVGHDHPLDRAWLDVEGTSSCSSNGSLAGCRPLNIRLRGRPKSRRGVLLRVAVHARVDERSCLPEGWRTA